MIETHPIRDPQQCNEKQLLIDQIFRSIDLIASIYNSELDGVLSGIPDESCSSRLQYAQKSTSLLMEGLRRHIAEHGC